MSSGIFNSDAAVDRDHRFSHQVTGRAAHVAIPAHGTWRKLGDVDATNIVAVLALENSSWGAHVETDAAAE